MSKLYNKYLNLKIKYPDDFLLFNNGLFYIFIDEDALFISENLGLKLTNLNDTVKKCGFPCSAISKYTKLLEENNLKFKLIDNNLDLVNNSPDYIHNVIIKETKDKLNNLNLDNISPIKALEILINLKKNFEDIK